MTKAGGIFVHIILLWLQLQNRTKTQIEKMNIYEMKLTKNIIPVPFQWLIRNDSSKTICLYYHLSNHKRNILPLNVYNSLLFYTIVYGVIFMLFVYLNVDGLMFRMDKFIVCHLSNFNQHNNILKITKLFYSKFSIKIQ